MLTTTAREIFCARRTSVNAIQYEGKGRIDSANHMRYSRDRTECRQKVKATFFDRIAIVGRPQFMIPIGWATFSTNVKRTVSIRSIVFDAEVDIALSGNLSAQCSGMAKSATNWAREFLTLPSEEDISQSVTIPFLIGAPIHMGTGIECDCNVDNLTERWLLEYAAFALATQLYPVRVVGVSSARIITLSDSESTYFVEGQAGSHSIPIHDFTIQLANS